MNYFVECNEPKIGRIVRKVQDFKRGLEHTMELQERMMQVPNMLDSEDSVGSLMALLHPSVHIFEVDDVGVVAFDQVVINLSARVHCTFWDRRLRGREKLCKSVIERFSGPLGLRVIYCENESPMIWEFLERVGFNSHREEGYSRIYEYVVGQHYLHDANRTSRTMTWAE
jgi:hypothetical protein